MSRLFKKTLIVVVALFLVISIAMSALSGWNIYRSLHEEFTVKGQSVADIIADAGIRPLLSGNPVQLQSMIDNYLNIDGVSYIAIADRDRRVIAHTFVPAVPEPVSAAIGDILDRAGEAAISGSEVQRRDGNMHIAAPILGGAAGVVLVGMDGGVIRAQIWSIIAQQQALMFALLLVCIGICYVLIDRISQPLSQLSRHAETLATTDIGKIGKLHKSIESIADHSHDEIGALARSFVSMEEALSESARQLADSVAERERIAAELSLARDIQMHMLPDISVLEELHHATRIEALIRPAQETGGDLFDCFLLGSATEEAARAHAGGDRLFFLVGDVSGKGIPAALFMSMTCALIRAKAAYHERPSEVLEAVNLELSANNENCMFVTVFCGVLDLRTRELTYCSAGHNAPYLVSSNQGVRVLECEQGVAMGISGDARYTDSRTTVAAGELLFMYTDGVTEALDSEGRLYAEDRLVSVLSGSAGEKPRRVLSETLEDLDRFAADAPQADDITMLAIQYGEAE